MRSRKSILILICLTLPLFTVSLFATEKDTVITLEKQIVTASRIPTSLENTNRTMTIIDREDIVNSAAQNVSELLEHVSGVDIRRRGASDVQADIHLRGSSFEETLLLLDGVKMNDPQTAHHNLDLPIALEDIERIEVLKGAGSRLYGPNAFGGVINIITRKEFGKKVSARLIGGEFGTADVSGSLSYPLGPSSHTITARKSVSSGYREGTEYDITSVSYKAHLVMDKSRQNIFAGYCDKPFGAAGFYAPGSHEWEHTKTFLMQTTGSLNINMFTVNHKLYWRNHDDAWLWDRTASTDTASHITNTFGGELQVMAPSVLGTSVLGIVGNDESINSSTLGDHERYSIGIVAEHQFSIKERFRIVPGIMVYKYARWGWKAFPGIDCGITISDNLQWYGSIGRSFRVPSYTEYYMNHPYIQGDPSVKPGEAISCESGITCRNAIVGGTLAGYYRDSKNTIDWLINNTTKIQTVTPRKVRTTGLEVEGDFFPQKLSAKIPVTKFGLSYTYILSEFDDITGYTSKYLGNPLQYQFGSRLVYRCCSWIDHSWQVKYEKRMTEDAYTLCDTRLNMHLWNAVLFFEVTNLFDTKYIDIATVPMPGRWVRGGLSVALKKKDET